MALSSQVSRLQSHLGLSSRQSQPLVSSHLTPLPLHLSPHDSEPPNIQATIDALGLEPHIEGGYFVLTDASTTMIPSPYPPTPLSQETMALVGEASSDFDPALRRLSSSIFYLLTPAQPIGFFHRNRSRIHHSWHRGRGCYVLIHPNGRVESFIVGPDLENRERLQWTVDGGVWKASFLLASCPTHSQGLLVSETVVPGFEYADHEFLSHQRCAQLLPDHLLTQLSCLVKH
ncbi:hypothetical protein CDD82_5006 [Ophiocordyceps australis]|uniref:DUF985 domain-containing protein n=1 Tax=Ophiocordyceps australis TaxID=1399860 RepID=A0A2C5ZSE1_9HYPO|nr:hypothetical protein CDD82_5006 [Ophiocordyceps australis]